MATQYVARRRLRIAEESDGWLMQVLNAYAGRNQRTLGPQLGKHIGRHVVVTGDVVKL
jgi:hypothetical protein